MSELRNLNISLEQFDGPLDLLDNLIRENKLNILDLDISLLTDQYLKFIEAAKNDIKIEIASEYLVMASYLLELKSKKILPQYEENTHADFNYERDKLVQRILQYRQYKQVVNKLLNKKEKRSLLIDKKPDDLSQFIDNQAAIIEKLPKSIDSSKLLIAFEKVINKYRETFYQNQKIIVQEFSVDDIKKTILLFLEKNHDKETSLTEYLSTISELTISLQYIVTVFLALLELAKYRNINLVQKQDDEIYFIKNFNDSLDD